MLYGIATDMFLPFSSFYRQQQRFSKSSTDNIGLSPIKAFLIRARIIFFT